MKVDNSVNSVINMVNTPVVNSGNGNTVTPQKTSDLIDQGKSTENINGKPETPDKEKLNKEKINNVINVANDAFKEVNIGFKYYHDKRLNRDIVEVVNSKTGEKIRQYPAEEIVNMLERMYDMLGILIDKKM